MNRAILSALYGSFRPVVEVCCAVCGRRVRARRVSKMRGGGLHPYRHKSMPCDGQPCEGHTKPGAPLANGN